jgi:hypothetical protein
MLFSNTITMHTLLCVVVCLILTTPRSVESILCYSCGPSSYAGITLACGDPFNANSINNATCYGTVCVKTTINYTSGRPTYSPLIYRATVVYLT